MDDQDVIRNQMEETRSALTEKLETLEKEVSDKVLSTTETVTDSVESVTSAVQQTVESVKDGVQETVAAVTDSVKDSLNAVKSLLDIPAHVEQYPAAMFVGSIAVGFCAGKFLQSPRKTTRNEPAQTASASAAPPREHRNGKHQRTAAPRSPGFLQEFAPEIEKLKGLALGALMGVVRELVAEAMPANYLDPVNEIITSVTEKIGGTRVPETPPEPSQMRKPGNFAVSRM